MRGFRFDEDYHVHSTFSDDAVSSPEENVAAAVRAGLATVCLVDHVRADTAWVPRQVATVRELARRAPLTVLSGVEAKILDADGHLDLPADAHAADLVLIADHQFPSESGPLSPSTVATMLHNRELRPGDVVVRLVEATVAAMQRVERPVIAHPFSLLPKLGLDESHVSDTLLYHLAMGARATGALVEVNEKWDCPGPRLVAALARSGVHLVAGSDSHHCDSVGSYPRVTTTLDAADGVPRNREPARTP